MSAGRARRRIRVAGIVQDVGFRPCVWRRGFAVPWAASPAEEVA